MRTRIIEASDLPQWNETFDLCGFLPRLLLTVSYFSCATDDKWKVTFNLLDAAGKLLGSVTPPRREIDTNLKDVQRWNFADLAPAITGTASIGIFIQQRDAMYAHAAIVRLVTSLSGKVSSNPVSELKKSPRPASPNHAKPMLTQSARSASSLTCNCLSRHSQRCSARFLRK